MKSKDGKHNSHDDKNQCFRVRSTVKRKQIQSKQDQKNEARNAYDCKGIRGRCDIFFFGLFGYICVRRYRCRYADS